MLIGGQCRCFSWVHTWMYDSMYKTWLLGHLAAHRRACLRHANVSCWSSSALASARYSTGDHTPSPDTEQLMKRASMWYCMPRESTTCLWTGWCVFLQTTPVHTSKFLLISVFFLYCIVEKAIALVSCCCVFRNLHRLIHSVKVTVKAAPLRLCLGQH